MITLYQFPGVWGLPNASPFCLKVETYLRMFEIPYEIKLVMNSSKAPKAKLPYIKINNEFIADSELIIDHLISTVSDSSIKNLTKEQIALTVLLDNIFSDRLLWVMVYLRWQDENGWSNLRHSFFVNLPLLAKLFVPRMVRRKVKETLYLQGMGRHSYSEILQMGYKTLDAIAVTLAEKKYFLGDKVTRIDATAFAFLANIAWLPYEDALKKHLHTHKNLLNYCERIWDKFYPEIAKPFNLISTYPLEDHKL